MRNYNPQKDVIMSVVKMTVKLRKKCEYQKEDIGPYVFCVQKLK